ncbi:hypothetical protein KDX04_04970 [Burkholderia cenocepacia]|nr:hypothetical protein [Burkholderia cenocepacia]
MRIEKPLWQGPDAAAFSAAGQTGRICARPVRIHCNGANRSAVGKDVMSATLFGTARHDLFRPGFQQIQMEWEAMMALRRLVIGPVWQDEEPDSAQHVKQLV